jgi:hypothetical protein
MDKIKTTFDQRFQRWLIRLPLDDLENRRSGSIQEQGWLINYRFGREENQDFLEYFASHRMTNDTLNRIWDDGTLEVIGYCQEFYLADNQDAQQAYLDHNRRFYQQVKESGLHP